MLFSARCARLRVRQPSALTAVAAALWNLDLSRCVGLRQKRGPESFDSLYKQLSTIGYILNLTFLSLQPQLCV